MTRGLDRRAVLASGGALALGGCVRCRLPDAATGVPLSDGHAHFFNASDLPVAAFIEYVIIPRYVPQFPDIALALVDLAGWLAKTLAFSVDEEMRRLDRGALFGGDGPDPNRFAEEAASLQERRIAAGGEPALSEADPRTDLAASHYRLAQLIGAVPDDGESGVRFDARRPIVDRAVYRDIARAAPSAAPQPQDIARGQETEAMVRAQAARSVKAILHWVYLMCLPRCIHVREYLRTIRTGEHRIGDAANLLVDYDKWLGEGPAAGSSHARQVAFWTRYARVTRSIPGVVRLHSFAGYDPLRAAEERREHPGEPSHLDRMKTWIAAERAGDDRAEHRIAGFKIYPPMGFRPDTNAGLRLPDERAGGVVNRRWRQRGWDLATLGTELDFELDQFFRYCAQEDVPILTHARESNCAIVDPCASASPEHWLARAEMVAAYGRQPLRVCVGHFDMQGTDEAVLRRALEMNAAGRARFYFDISYDGDVLRGGAAWLLGRLRAVCERVPGGENAILFGSDWIMLGQEPNASSYLAAILEAARQDDGYWARHIDKMFRKNFLDFLGRRPA